MMKSTKMKWAGHIALMEDMRNAYKNLVGSLKWRDRSGDRWEGNISIFIKERWCKVVNWIQTA